MFLFHALSWVACLFPLSHSLCHSLSISPNPWSITAKSKDILETINLDGLKSVVDLLNRHVGAGWDASWTRRRSCSASCWRCRQWDRRWNPWLPKWCRRMQGCEPPYTPSSRMSTASSFFDFFFFFWYVGISLFDLFDFLYLSILLLVLKKKKIMFAQIQALNLSNTFSKIMNLGKHFFF